MAFLLADRVRESTLTNGTGTLSLAGAPAQYQSFIAGIGNANSTFYEIRSGDGVNWEVGLGTVTAGAPNTLSRTTVLSSSNAGELIAITGTSDVFCVAPAALLMIIQSLTHANITDWAAAIAAALAAATFTTAQITGFAAAVAALIAAAWSNTSDLAVEALGVDQGSAYQMVAALTIVAGGAAGAGVQMVAATPGQSGRLFNASGTMKKLYANGAGTINGEPSLPVPNGSWVIWSCSAAGEIVA